VNRQVAIRSREIGVDRGVLAAQVIPGANCANARQPLPTFRVRHVLNEQIVQFPRVLDSGTARRVVEDAPRLRRLRPVANRARQLRDPIRGGLCEAASPRTTTRPVSTRPSRLCGRGVGAVERRVDLGAGQHPAYRCRCVPSPGNRCADARGTDHPAVPTKVPPLACVCGCVTNAASRERGAPAQPMVSGESAGSEARCGQRDVGARPCVAEARRDRLLLL